MKHKSTLLEIVREVYVLKVIFTVPSYSNVLVDVRTMLVKFTNVVASVN